MESQFAWDESFSVGDQDLNVQHQRMIHLANEIRHIEVNDIKKVLVQIYQHTRDHFNAEEKHMEEIGYPELTEHKQLHQELFGDLNRVAGSLLDSEKAAQRISEFLLYWVHEHILNEDKKYFEFYRQQSEP